MPRISLAGFAVGLGCLSATAVAAIISLSVAFMGAPARIGSSVPVSVTCDSQGTPTTAYVVFGTAPGRTVIAVNGAPVMVPLGGTVWMAATGTISGRGVLSATIPLNPGLIGATLRSAVVVGSAGSFSVSCMTGGPIIEDILN